jgi:hypothetical protein
MTAVNVVLALLAACSNAVSNVLQRKANLQEPSDRALSLRLVGHLIRNRFWLGGIGAVILSFVLQALALGTGTLAAVTPIIVLELPLTLVLAAFTLGSPLRGSELADIAVMTAGLALVLIGLDPRGALHPTVSASTWTIGLSVTVALVVGLVILGAIATGTRRALLFGAATGIEFGMTAGLTKAMTSAFAAGGFVGALSSWSTYAMVAAGLLGMFLLQNALQAGRLVASQPGITLLDPVTAVAWGVLAFQETVNGGAWWAVTAGGAVAMAVGVVLLVRSPGLALVSGDQRQPGQPSQAEPIHGRR